MVKNLAVADDMEDAVREASRSLIDASPHGVGWDDLFGMGWFELDAEDSRMANRALFGELGRHAATSRALDATTASALERAGAELTTKTELGFVYPVPGGPSLAGRLLTEGTADVDGILLGAHLPAGSKVLAFVVSPYDRTALVAVETAPGCEIQEVEGVDPSLGLRRLTGRGLTVSQTFPQELADLALATARRSLAYESVGLAGEILRISIAHVTERHQFGRAIGSYQAVQHRLADVQVAIGAAHAALQESWEDVPEQELTVLIAKSLGSQALDLAVRHGLQVCGGMGFTEEFPLAPLVRRALFLVPFLGSGPALNREIGRRLVSRRAVPRIARFHA